VTTYGEALNGGEYSYGCGEGCGKRGLCRTSTRLPQTQCGKEGFRRKKVVGAQVVGVPGSPGSDAATVAGEKGEKITPKKRQRMRINTAGNPNPFF